MLFRQNERALGAKLSGLKIGIIVSLGLVTTSTVPVLASSPSGKNLEQQRSVDTSSEIYLAQGERAKSPLADGIYLYGQSPESEQIGQEYLVFKIQQEKVVGAVYMPRSEFNCFSGTVDSRQMNLSIVDPYDNTVYPHAIALQDLSPVASDGKLPRAVGLEGYHQISPLSDSDRRILDTCLTQN
jgi:hypothetical protein